MSRRIPYSILADAVLYRATLSTIRQLSTHPFYLIDRLRNRAALLDCALEPWSYLRRAIKGTRAHPTPLFEPDIYTEAFIDSQYNRALQACWSNGDAIRAQRAAI